MSEDSTGGTDGQDGKEGKEGGEARGMRTVQRTIDILELFNEHRPALSLREIVTTSGLPKTTVLRILQTLRLNGLLWLDEHGRYTAGPAFLRWVRMADQGWRLPAPARRALRELAAEHRETVHLYVRRDVHRICIAQEEGPQALRHVVQVGDELPLWAGGPSKVLLLGADDTLLDRVARRSPHGPDHATTLRRWVAETLHNGYAVSHGEHEEGLSAVAVPVRARGGEVVAALSFGGPSARFTAERLPRFVNSLTMAARAVGGSGGFGGLRG
ncbi:IclR family transcriptional regulator [Streptomyces sp. FXJ1.4098]|uniref:IclR family transcriptional regulator n=1 Tax=Streptomyces sp. NPDC020845 TaxID=3365096 RepID=UPI002993896F|nr:IclR family transcriptional regulator [Streptomyces sp. FXJ1.4098]